ncbi:MAG: hypothetical protein NE330_22975, partial [Lentisphaeraceae bacterium]|nr:hypothetical protein [Lentisphaeraceae bacterium]
MNKITLLIVSTFFIFSIQSVSASESLKKVLLLSGKKSHGYGHHECNSDISVLKNLLERQTKAEFSAKIFLNGAWPEDSEFGEADAIVICCDGDQKHILKNRMEKFDSILKAN